MIRTWVKSPRDRVRWRKALHAALCALASALLTLALHSLPAVAQEKDLAVTDLGPTTGFQDNWDNHYRRGRSIVAEDFDGDGRLDYFIGNPADESFVFRNLGPGSDGVVRFMPAQVLLRGDLAFVASGADYDNDGDLDLFVGCGGLDGACLDFLFRNDSEPGLIQFTDVSLQAGIRGPAVDGVPLAHATGGGTWGDYDRDGDPDLFVSLRGLGDGTTGPRGVLWKNNGNGTFSDATGEAQLNSRTSEVPYQPIIDFRGFQNSTWIDTDNDGDLDLFLNNASGPNVLWKNHLAEQGNPRFVDATQAFSLPREDLRYPYFSFASAVADFNNDGWQDLMLFAAGWEPPVSPYGSGNGLFLNRPGQGFFNAARVAGINVSDGVEVAMGCQVADLNADGIPDLAVGAGNPQAGKRSRLLLSRGETSEGIPLFTDASLLIDFAPPHGIDPAAPPFPEIPPYPYRTHGMAAGDADGDGHLELAVVSGGPASGPPIVREPNRLFKFSGAGLGGTFRVHLKGNGTTDSRDAIGARAYIEIPAFAGTRRVFQTVLAGSGFSAQNERTLTFGLGRDTRVSRLAILWPSGCLQVLEDQPVTPSPLVVNEACWKCPGAPGPVQVWLDPDVYYCSRPPTCRIEGTISDVSGPVPWTRVVESHGDPPELIEGRSGPDGTFALEHPYEPGRCQVAVQVPFGYLPVPNPVWVEEEGTYGPSVFDLVLNRAPEAREPLGIGYWLHQAKNSTSGRPHAQETAADMAAWMGAIRARYPALTGFDSMAALAEALEGSAPHLVDERLRRHLGAALLNLASGRLSSFTLLVSRERVGDLVERGYRWLGTPGAAPDEAAALAERLEALNEGSLFP
jgi:hypothetical protein